MTERSTGPSENEESDDALQRAIASIQEEAVAAGPPPELVASVLHSLWYPFRSSEVTDLFRHLTPEESRRLTAYSWKAGLICGIVPSLFLYPFLWILAFHTPLYPPRPWSILVLFAIAIPLGLLIGWIGFAGVRKKVRVMLYETDYAKRMGFVPDALPLYNVAGNKRTLVLFIVAFALPIVFLSLLCGRVVPDPGDPGARQIIDRMATVYATCGSYRDSGVVTTLFVQDGGNRRNEKTFSTAFVRGGRFHFEYREKMGERQMRYLIWSNGEEVLTWWDVKPGIDKPKSLGFALGGATGVSGGSAAAIPALLLPGEVWGSLSQISEARLAEDGRLDGVECFRVEGNYGRSPITLWIDKTSYLVRRIDQPYEVKQSEGKDYRVEQTTTYDPIVDEEIADKLLDFDPPVPK
jgi:hypothetical protein